MVGIKNKQSLIGAAKPECSIAELRRIERKGRKEKILPGFQPGSSDFRSPLKCNFKPHKLSLFPLCASPRGIKPLSFQYWAVAKLVSSFSYPKGDDCPINPTVPGEVNSMYLCGLMGRWAGDAVPHFSRPGRGQVSGTKVSDLSGGPYVVFYPSLYGDRGT